MFDSGANCFLNALVREFPLWERQKLPTIINESIGYDSGFHFDLGNSEQLILPLIAYSSFGRSYFHAEFYIYNAQQQNYKTLNFNQLLAVLEQNPAVFADTKLGQPLAKNLKKVLTRSAESQHNIQTVLRYRQSEIDPLFNQTLNFIDSEQSLLVGHSIHPCPKSRSGFNQSDEERYVPEFANEFQLSWFAVDKSILYVFAGNDTAIEAYCDDLTQSDDELTALRQQLPANYLVIPCHPWQAQHWKSNPALTQYFEQNQLIELGAHGKPWRATSSLRSLYQADSPWMLKFSLSTQLTNSVRHLQPEEMIRGQVIEKVLSSPKAQAMQQAMPHFSIMREPISLALKSIALKSIALKEEHDQAMDSTAIIWRENPFYQQVNDRTEVLSGLLQDLPDQAQNRLTLRLQQQAEITQTDVGDLAKQFLQQFLQVVIKPIIVAQAQYGLLFGAHQQNIVIQFDDNMMPIKTFFRDCQGTGFSSLAKQLYGEALLSDTSASGNFFEDDTVIHLFTYYLLVNSCFNTISSLTLTNLISETEALSMYQDFLQTLKAENHADSRVVDYLLEAEHIWSKGNFYCNLHAINENTMSDPFLIYHQLKNPLQSLTTKSTNAA